MTADPGPGPGPVPGRSGGPSDDLAARAATLRAELAEHGRRYHELDAPTIADADYGDQHGILKPRRAGQVRAQDNTEVEYPLSLRVGQRYALVLSAMSPAAGSTVTLSMTGADIIPYEFSAPGSWPGWT